jgi:acyl dehydratase
MLTLTGIDEVKAHVGQELGVSDWHDVTQEAIDEFADVTGDHQFIHVDPERAKETPFGGTIAHGYLTLSLLPVLMGEVWRVEDARMGINYGLNRVRFPAPVPVGSRLRLHAVLVEAAPQPDGAVHMTVEQTLEIEGSPKPAVVAQTLSRVVY